MERRVIIDGCCSRDVDPGAFPGLGQYLVLGYWNSGCDIVHIRLRATNVEDTDVFYMGEGTPYHFKSTRCKAHRAELERIPKRRCSVIVPGTTHLAQD